MNKINYISSSIIPIIIVVIVFYGMFEKNKVFDTFIDGAREGAYIVFNIFPTLIGIFLAVGALRSSGILELVINLIQPITSFFKFPKEIIPLALLRPISGSASMGVATDIIKTYGVDTTIRNDCIMYYGSYRNYIIYNCNLYKFCKNKENKICIVSIVNCRCSRDYYFCNNLSIFVLEFFLTNVKKSCNMYMYLKINKHSSCNI